MKDKTKKKSPKRTKSPQVVFYFRRLDAEGQPIRSLRQLGAVQICDTPERIAAFEQAVGHKPIRGAVTYQMTVHRGQENAAAQVVENLEISEMILVLGGDFRKTAERGPRGSLVDQARLLVNGPHQYTVAPKDILLERMSAATCREAIAMGMEALVMDGPRELAITMQSLGRHIASEELRGVLRHLIALDLTGQAFWAFWQERCLVDDVDNPYRELVRQLDTGEADDVAGSYVNMPFILAGHSDPL